MYDLGDSWRRHRRAQEHVADIEELVNSVRCQRKLVLASDTEVESGEKVLKLPPAESPSDDLGLRIGEAAYNFRAGLDYAVHIMSGRERKSQFPIEDNRERFESRKTGRLPNGKDIAPYLKGVGARECDLIKAVQPCEGID